MKVVCFCRDQYYKFLNVDFYLRVVDPSTDLTRGSANQKFKIFKGSHIISFQLLLKKCPAMIDAKRKWWVQATLVSMEFYEFYSRYILVKHILIKTVASAGNGCKYAEWRKDILNIITYIFNHITLKNRNYKNITFT